MKTFENAKVGDKVYDLRYGVGAIIEIRDGYPYPLEVKFKNRAESYEYSYIGYEDTKNEIPMLYWDKPQIIAPKKLLQDKELVWAWDSNYKTTRTVGFYDSKNDGLFYSDTGSRDGAKYDIYSPYEDKEPEWAIEARKHLKD